MIPGEAVRAIRTSCKGKLLRQREKDWTKNRDSGGGQKRNTRPIRLLRPRFRRSRREQRGRRGEGSCGRCRLRPRGMSSERTEGQFVEGEHKKPAGAARSSVWLARGPGEPWQPLTTPTLNRRIHDRGEHRSPTRSIQRAGQRRESI